MNREQKRQILRRYSNLSMQIQNLTDMYQEIYTEATHITPAYTEGSGSHDNESKIEKKCIKLAEISERINKAKAKQRRVDKALARLKPYHRYLLTQVDINGQGIKRVANKTHKDPSSLARTYNKALDALNLEE